MEARLLSQKVMDELGKLALNTTTPQATQLWTVEPQEEQKAEGH